MAKARIKEKAIALFIVLATILVIIALANAILTIILSQSRLTHHQVSRIQAYYAAMAGINFALEQLRTGAWTFSPTNDCPDPNGCLVTEDDFPDSILSFDASGDNQARVIFCPGPDLITGAETTCAGATNPCRPPAGTGINFCVNSTALYTYTP